MDRNVIIYESTYSIIILLLIIIFYIFVFVISGIKKVSLWTFK